MDFFSNIHVTGIWQGSGFYSYFKTFFGCIHKRFGLFGYFAHLKHGTSVSVVSIQNSGDVYIYNITFLEHNPGAWNPMALDLVQANTAVFRIAIVTQTGRAASVLDSVFTNKFIDF